MLHSLIRSALFCLIAGSSIVPGLLLFGQRKEMWDGPCGYKLEYGYFEFFRSSDRLFPPECVSGILWPGVVMTATSVLLIIAFVLLAYKRLRPFRR